MEGKKNDTGKAQLDLIPWDVFAPLARDWPDRLLTTPTDVKYYAERLSLWWRLGDTEQLQELFMSVCDECTPEASSPYHAMIETVLPVLEFGAKKYAPWNWAKGMKWSRLYAAALRHWLAHMSGDRTDPETGFLHLQHLACCLMFLVVYEHEGLGEDDRPDYAPRRLAA